MRLLLLLLLVLSSMTIAAQSDETYTIEPGDVLDVIAQEFDVSLECLLDENGIVRGEPIFPGDELVISADCPPYGTVPAMLDTSEGGGQGGGVAGELYVVQPGDTLDGIAQEYDVSLISLRRANDFLAGVTIMPGQTILIPEGAPAYGVVPALDVPDTSEGGGQGGGVDGELYVIQPLDNIDQIAANFDVSTSCITEANGITNVRLITPGQTLLIPNGCPAYQGAAVATPMPDAGNEDEEESQPLGES